ncbi:hypothetical protein DKX38_026796 [Salix brachista]|uniref:GST C-terminal domain-containing protein n=1 Tax=Salix brachista TaxID=2182728 RepID=A0A5N5JAD9_9ROSI|nr:hypothetical protein DKX38_026796 [Salix brachista]
MVTSPLRSLLSFLNTSRKHGLRIHCSPRTLMREPWLDSGSTRASRERAETYDSTAVASKGKGSQGKVGDGASKENVGRGAFNRGSGEDQLEKAAKELLESLKILEEQGLGDKKFFGGESINLVDISYGALGYWFPALEEAKGVKVLEPRTLPRLHAWAKNFVELPVVKENIPAYDKMLAYAMKRLARN